MILPSSNSSLKIVKILKNIALGIIYLLRNLFHIKSTSSLIQYIDLLYHLKECTLSQIN